MPPESRDDRLEALAARYRAARLRGEEPSLDAFANAEPDLATSIRELFPLLDVLDLAGRQVAPEASIPPLGKDFGDYEIERELGRGGMGVVYEARQRSLDRRVALKVLPGPMRWTPQRLERFRREAHAAARLRHPNIVPVFEVGEREGIHYYAMQLIDGVGLDAVLRAMQRNAHGTPRTRSAELASRLLESDLGDEPTSVPSASATPLPEPVRADPLGSPSPYLRNVVRIGIQVARALAHAHAEGVLHRDLKPQNLLLDGQGRVWVTDFGLAKTKDGDEITHEGDVLGSPRYLAPESLRGWADPRTDVWGVGVTLYELLTRRPAFHGEDRATLLQRIAHEAPVPPRRFDRRIPRDLETIVSTTLEKEPARRYASAMALAEDLERFQRGLPIHARRASVFHRSGLFLRRHRVATTAVVLGLLSLSIVLGVALWFVSGARARETLALEREREARGRAILERERAEAHFQMALQAVHSMLARLEEARLSGAPHLEELRRRVFQEAVAFHRRFLERRIDDPRLLRSTVHAWVRLGSLEWQLEHLEEGETCLRHAEGLLREALERRPEDATFRAALALVLAHQGKYLHEKGSFEPAERTFDELRVGLETIDVETLDLTAVRDVLFAWRIAAAHAYLEGLGPMSESTLGHAIERADRVLARKHEDPIALEFVREERRDALVLRARLHRSAGRDELAVNDLRAALGEFDRVAVPTPTLLHARAQAEILLASLLLELGRTDAARVELDRGLSKLEGLAEEFPERAGLLDARLEALVLRGVLLASSGRTEEASRTLSLAIEAFDENGQARDVFARRLIGLEARLHLGATEFTLGRMDAARRTFQSIVTDFERLEREVAAFESQPRAVERFAFAMARLGSLLAEQGRLAEGEPYLRRSLATYRRLPADARIAWRRDRILTTAALARALGDQEEALDLLDEARELALETLATAPDSLGIREAFAIVCRSRRRILERLGDPEAVIVTMRDELEQREALLARAPSDPRVLSEVASVANDLALHVLERSEHAQARSLLERAIELQSQALERLPDHPVIRSYLVNHHWNLGLTLFHEHPLEAARTTSRAGELSRMDPSFQVEVAVQVLRCAARLPPEVLEPIEDDALRALERAVEQGFRDRARLENDPALEPLRDRKEFGDVLARIAR